MAIDYTATVSHDNSNPFTPNPFYEPITDSVLMYLRDERSYAKRISKHFTLFASIADESLVGFEIKGVKDICNAIDSDGLRQIVGPIDVSHQDGKCELSIMVRIATMSPEIMLNGNEYDVLNVATKGKRLNRKELQLCETS